MLIDADNTSPKVADGLFDEVAKIGEASLRRIYGDFSKGQQAGWERVLARHAIQPTPSGSVLRPRTAGTGERARDHDMLAVGGEAGPVLAARAEGPEARHGMGQTKLGISGAHDRVSCSRWEGWMSTVEQVEPEISGDRPLVTLLLISYNQEDMVREAFEGALAQTYSPLEIFVSDNASTDRSFDVIKEVAAGYSGPHRVVLHRNETNLGMMGNIDHAMSMVSGEFVVSNHGDDVSLPHRVERLVEVWLASGKRAKAIHSARRRMDDAGRLHEIMEDNRVLADMTPLEVVRDHGTLVGATLGWSRELWDVFGPISPIGIFDDFPTCFRASLIGEIRYVPEPLLNYRQGGTSARPSEERGYNYLYGFRIKSLRWHKSFWQRYLADMETVRPPDYEECRRICLQKIATADFAIALAESAPHRVPLAIPQAVRLSLAERDMHYLKDVGRYMLGPLYRRRLDRKNERARLRRSQAT